MCRIEIVTRDGEQLELENTLSLRLERELDVPADIARVTCLFDDNIRKNADAIRIFSSNELVFRGRLDSVTTQKGANGIIMKLVARSLAAGLLDCEAEPLVYANPSAEFIFNKHAKPFGLTDFEADGMPLFGVLKISKGMSHWQVLQSFCRHKYLTDAYVSPGGTVYFRGFDSDSGVIFGDKSDTLYYKIKEDRLRCRLITDVRLRLGATEGYRSSLKNPNPECAEIQRTRFVDAAADNSSIEIADRIIEKSNRNSYRLELECEGCLSNLLGKRAIVKDSELGRLEGLRVCAVQYTMSPGLETSKVILRREIF